MSFKKIVGILAILVLIISIVTGCGNKNEEQWEERVIPVEVQKVEKGNIENYYSTSGEIIPKSEVRLMASMQKKAKMVSVDVGSYVSEGDLLLEMDNEELKSLVNKAKASLAGAQANLDKAIRGARDQEIEQVKAGVDIAEAAYLSAEQDYNRMKSLYEAEALPKQQLDMVELKYITAENQFKTAKEQLSLIEEGADEETVKTLEAQVNMAKASLEQAQAGLDNSYLTSPISGIVAFKNIEPGEMPSMGNPVFTIVDMSQVKVKFNVPEEVIGSISLGDEVKLEIGTVGLNEITGKVTQLSPASDFRYKAFPVEVTIDNPPESLKSGMFAQIYIPLEKKKDVFIIPKEALTEENDEHYVYLVNNEHAHKTKIITGIEDEKNIEVLMGLKEKDLIIILGTNLQDKAKVSIVEGGSEN